MLSKLIFCRPSVYACKLSVLNKGSVCSTLNHDELEPPPPPSAALWSSYHCPNEEDMSLFLRFLFLSSLQGVVEVEQASVSLFRIMPTYILLRLVVSIATTTTSHFRNQTPQKEEFKFFDTRVQGSGPLHCNSVPLHVFHSQVLHRPPEIKNYLDATPRPTTLTTAGLQGLDYGRLEAVNILYDLPSCGEMDGPR
jgi:hypothetical protein